MEELIVKQPEAKRDIHPPDEMSFVFVSLQRINTDRESTSTSIAKELSKHHRVLYINPPIDRRTLLTGKGDHFSSGHIKEIRSGKKSINQLNSNLWMYNPHSIMESINWLPSTTIFAALNKLNNKRFAKEIRNVIDELGFKNFILVNDKDMFRSFHLKEYLNPQRFVYLYRDYTLAYNYWKKHGTKLEPLLLQQADAVLCNSYGFKQLTKQFNNNSYFIGNGCNVNLFDGYKKWDKPAELANLPRPIIGYCGALTKRRLNINLLTKIAEARPYWNMVFIGTECEEFQRSPLHQMPNVHFLGQKNTRELPAYIRHFDVCINPQLINELTRDNYPLKIDEYLAMGRPVVATATTTMKEIFKHHTYLCDDDDSYIGNIEAALSADTEEWRIKRIEFARSHSWENVTREFIHALKKINA